MVREVIAPIKNSLVSVWNRWDAFWFTPTDPLSMSIIRILVGSMLLYSHLVWGTSLEAFFDDQGWNNRALLTLLQPDGVSPSFWWYVPKPWMISIHWLCNGILVLFVLGLGGRFTALLAWVISVSYANRSMLANFGLDQMLCIFMLYLAIAPSTQKWSLDSLIRRKLRWNETTISKSVLANVSMRLIQIHLCVIYLWAGLSKLQGEAWWNGDAMWLALANEEYQSLDMTWLVSFPRLMEFMTHTTVAWELSFAALVWPQATRKIVLALGIGMHLGIGLFLGMWTFGLIMIFAYVAFVPSAAIQASLRWIRFGSQAKPTSTAISSSPILGLEYRDRSIRKVQDVMETFVLISDTRSTLARAVSMLANSHREFVAANSLPQAMIIAKLVRNPVVLQLQLEEFDPACDWLEMRVIDLAQPINADSENGFELDHERSLVSAIH